MELKDFIRILWRRRLIIVLALAVGSGSALFFASQQQSVYEASAKIFIGPRSIDRENAAQVFDELISTRDFIASYAQLIKSRTLAERVVERLGIAVAPIEISSNTTAEVVKDTRIILVRVTNADPQRAALLANTVSEIFVEDIRRQLGSGTQTSVYEPAVPSTRRISPKPRRDGAVGGFLGLMIGVGAALVLSQLDTRIRSRDDIEHWLPAYPVLAEVPQSALGRGDLFITEDPRSPSAESFRILRTNVQFLGVDQPVKTILVTSPFASDGKTTVATNLAASLAAAGYRTILLDADLRRPMIHNQFKVPVSPGISDVLIGQRSLADAVRQTSLPNLEILTAGAQPPNPSELLGSQRMVDLLSRVAEETDMVVIDTPPSLPVTDSAVLGPHSDGVILVVRAGRTPRERVKTALSQFDRGGVRVLGLVLNGSEQADSAYYYYYGEGTKRGRSRGKNSANGTGEALRPGKAAIPPAASSSTFGSVKSSGEFESGNGSTGLRSAWSEPAQETKRD